MSRKEQQARNLAWDVCYNAREVGGYATEDGGRIRWHTLIRADNLYYLTPEGQAALRSYGVRTIIDLRLADELERYPSPFDTQQTPDDPPRYRNLPLHDPDTSAVVDAADSMQSGYIAILERNKTLVAAVIEAVSDALEEGAVLVHCHGGKDRTGIIVALLLSLANVPRETIVEDYALSETRLEPLHAAWVEAQTRARGQPVERPRWMYSRPETMRGLLEYLDRQYGGVEGYLEAAGVRQASIEQIRKYLVTPGDGPGS